MDGIRQFLGGVQYALQPSEAAVTLQRQPFACGGGTLFPVKDECRPYRLDVVP